MGKLEGLFQELYKALKETGDVSTQAEYARLLEVHESLVSHIFAGDIKVSDKTAASMIAIAPAGMKSEILRAWLHYEPMDIIGGSS